MGFRFVFKTVVFLFLLIVLESCKDLPRDNLFDPQNPNSFTNTRVLVEAFVNTAHPSPYNTWALQSLHALQQKYPHEFILCEYHRDIQTDTATYDDPYNTGDNQIVFKLLQDRYVSRHSNVPRVMPDVYLNGATHRFVGAYNSWSMQEQIEPVFFQLRTKNYFKLEPVIKKIDRTTLSLKCRVAGLGKQTVRDKRLRVIFLKEHWDQTLSLNLSVVSKLVWPSVSVPEIKNGSYKTVDLGRFNFKNWPDRVVVALVSTDESKVFQSVYTDLPL